jgi:hypothetical protein
MPRQARGRGQARRGGRGRPVRNVRPPAHPAAEQAPAHPVQHRNDDQIMAFLREIRNRQDAIDERLAAHVLPAAPALPAPVLPAPVLPAPVLPAPALPAPAPPAPALPVLVPAPVAAIPVPGPPRVARTTEAYNELPRFDGTTYYETYERQFRGVLANYPDLSNADKALLLMRCLQGKALRVLDSRSHSMRTSAQRYSTVSHAKGSTLHCCYKTSTN